jgi:ABC-2 type transport system ATP-binding protein
MKEQASMLVSISSLRISLGGVAILHDINLTLGAGELDGLLGPNGAGKSTTIAATLGLLIPDGGEVRVFGMDPAREAASVHRRLGALPEQNGFYGWMTALEYLRFFDRLHGRNSSDAALWERMARLSLSPRPKQQIGTFSHGMRQRLGLARAMIADPALLILDEPTNGLDPRGRREIHDILLELSDRGVGILLCTHLLDDVERLCDRVGIIAQGRTVVEGSISELVGIEKLPTHFRLRLAGAPPAGQSGVPGLAIRGHEGDHCLIDLAPGVAPERAWRKLLEMGWPIVEIRREGSGLEDIYLELTERSAA